MLRWSILAFLIVAAAVGSAVCGLQVRGMTMPLGVVGLVGVAAFHFRKEERFILCLSALAQISLFSMAFVVLTYLGAEMARPLIDRCLTACDASLGFHLPAVVAWQQQHPIIGRMLQLAYDSLLLQTAAIVAILGFLGDRKPLELFILRMMLAALVTLAIFMVIPAEGPFEIYEIAPSATQAHYLEQFRALRVGAFHQFSYRDAEGLITFPSFHAVWALLLFMAVRRRLILGILFGALNAAVILSTMTTGWHYLSDVLAGLLIGVMICWLTSRSWEGGGWPFVRSTPNHDES